MIEVFNRSENGKDRLVATAATYADLFSPLTEGDLKAFGYLPSDRCAMPRLFGEPLMMNYMGWNIFPTRYCYIVFDDGLQVNPDRLVGLFRKWKALRPKRYRSWRTHTAYGSYRKPHTTRERKWSQPCGEDTEPRSRVARNARHLPNAWDDKVAHNDKSWKTQSKRRHQWKHNC